MKTVMCLDLDALISHFEKYFSEDMEKYNWIRNPFLDNAYAPRGFTSLEVLSLWKIYQSYFCSHFEKHIQPSFTHFILD